MYRTSIVVLSLCMLGGGAQAAEIEGALTDETLEGRYITDAGLIGLGGNDLWGGILLSDERDIVGTVGLMVPGAVAETPEGPITFSVGAKAHAALLADPDDEVFGVLPGAQARFRLPLGMPMWVLANIFYSPDIVTFGDADDILDFNVRYEVQFLETTTGFVGFRLLDFDREGGGDDDIVEGLQLGVRVAF